MISYEYALFLREKILEYLPRTFVNVGGRYNGRCPFCGDSHRSATKRRGWWYADKDCSYYCFNCGAGMSGIKFLELLSGSSYDDIRSEYVRLFLKSGLNSDLSASFAKPEDEPGLFQLKPMVRPGWKKPMSDEAREYLARRKVLDAPFLHETLYSCQCKGGAEYILIPWVLNGVEAYYQLNDFKKHGPIKYVYPKDSKKLVYGLDNVDLQWKNIIVFEGVYDSLFVKNGIAVGTKSITEYQLRLIRERYAGHRICVSFDNDEPGVQAMIKLIRKGADVMFFKWFGAGTAEKDINDYVLATGDVTAFSDVNKLDRMILTPLQMKLWLIQNDKWREPSGNGPYSEQRSSRKIQQREMRDVRS